MLTRELNLREDCFNNKFFKKIDLNLPLDLVGQFEDNIKKLDKDFAPYSYGDMYNWDGLILNEKEIKEVPSFYSLIYEYLPFEEIMKVRVFRLKPKGYCGWHTEKWEPQEKEGKICCTLNIALSSPEKTFIAFEKGRRLRMLRGDVCFLNFNKLHSAQNLGDSIRYHLKVTGFMQIRDYQKYFNKLNLFSCVDIWNSKSTIEMFKWKLKTYEKCYPIKLFVLWADGFLGERIVDIFGLESQARIIFFHTSQDQLNLKKELLNIWPDQSNFDIVSFVENFCQKNNLFLQENDSRAVRATLDLWNNQNYLRERFKKIRNTAKLEWVKIDERDIYRFLIEQCDNNLSKKIKVFWLNGILNNLSFEKRKAFMKKVTGDNQLICFSGNTSF